MPRSEQSDAEQSDAEWMGMTRRGFCAGGSAALVGGLWGWWGVWGQTVASVAAGDTHPDVAAIDRARILAQAERYLTAAPVTVTSLPSLRSPGGAHDYFSEAVAEADFDAVPVAAPGAPVFTAQRDALFRLGLAVPALTAAYVLTKETRYAEGAAVHLRAWFVAPATRMNPSLDYGSVLAGPKADEGGRLEGILETLPLAEVAVAVRILAESDALSDADVAGVKGWFAAYLTWLTAPQDSGPRLAALARDSKDRNGSSWMLQVAAYTLLTVADASGPANESSAATELRHRFRRVMLRAQMRADGTFPNELRTANPYRNSLENLDLFAGICQLLSTRFESVWEYQLEDGPGMRSAIAYHFPYIADRTKWPFRADAAHFNELPGRRESLLLCARAYQRPEYAALWKELKPDPADEEVLRSLPLRQPLLWARRA
jgi:Alginate lyase